MPRRTARANARKWVVRAAVERVLPARRATAYSCRTIGIARARTKIGLANLLYKTCSGWFGSRTRLRWPELHRLPQPSAPPPRRFGHRSPKSPDPRRRQNTPSLGINAVIGGAQLDDMIRHRGRPSTIVSDNATELTANAILSWAGENSVMVYSFARISAVVAMQVEDYFANGKRWWLQLHGKAASATPQARAFSTNISMPQASGITARPPIRSAAGRTGLLTELAMHRRRRVPDGPPPHGRGRTERQARLPRVPRDRDHRLSRGRWHAQNAQAMAAHESPRTTKLYDRTGDEITLDEVEKYHYLRASETSHAIY